MHSKNAINVKRCQFPCGEMIIGSFDGKLCLCNWVDGKHHTAINYRLQKMLKAVFQEETTDIIEMAKYQLDEYFNRQRREFDIPLLFVGSDFQKNVWNELLKIPYGSTLSYGDLAQRLGDPNSFRAVANANSVNAISIIVPCHRVVGNDGTLKGYNGGVEKKEFLIDLESSTH